MSALQIQQFKIEGPLLIQPQVFKDERGFFTERFQEERFAKHGLDVQFIQDNFSRSTYGVLRGLHFQYDPPQSKLVTCTRGLIQDVIVDVRKNSPSFGKYVEVELSGDDPKWFFIPAGFAHGFCVLSSEGADLLYKVDTHYNPKGEVALKWNDSDLNIPWKISKPSLSPKDEQGLALKEYMNNLKT